MRDLFVTVFGYTINPEANFNLLTEQKNVNNSKKALELKAEIDKTDEKIDGMLYGLIEEEIKIVEGE